jgi:hypothetical protein
MSKEQRKKRKMIKKRILTTLVVMAALLSMTAVPALATENGLIVLSDGGSLALVDPANPSSIGNAPGSGMHPTVTPDGKTVVYVQSGAESSTPEIASVPIDGSATRTVLTSTEDPNYPYIYNQYPTVSPDGKTVYFWQQKYTDPTQSVAASEIKSVPIGGGNATTVFDDEPNKEYYNLKITPDGQNFVFDDGHNIFTLPVSGGAVTRLTNTETWPNAQIDETRPDISPDGTKVVFWSEGSLYTVPFSPTGGQNRTKLNTTTTEAETDCMGNNRYLSAPEFSPDGQFIEYSIVQYPDCPSDVHYDFLTGRVKKVPASGGTTTDIIAVHETVLRNSVWAPKTPDTTKPSSFAFASPRANSTGWNTSDVTVTLRASDNFGGSGVDKITYSATGAQSIAETTYDPNSPPVIKNDGTTTISYYATDKAGNVGDTKSLTIKIDKTNPVTTLEAVTEDGSYESGKLTNKDVTLNLSATDESGSGVGSITYKVTNGGQELASKTVSGDKVSIPVTTEGENTITYYATDKVGRKEAAQSFTVTLDKSAPSVSSTTPGNLDTNVRRSTTLTASFPEAMDPKTLTTKTVQLFSGNSKNPLKAQVSVSADGKTVTLTPAQKLDAKTEYTAKILGQSSGVKDLASNPLAEDVVWHFTTGSQ